MQLPIAIPSDVALDILPKLVSALLQTRSLQTNTLEPISQYLDDLIDACVMECYFREHMEERGLLFLDDLAPHLVDYDSDARETSQREFLTNFHRTLNAPDAKIRNRLLRLTADSPDLLAVIKEEGRI